jgi:hypothetical protein
MSRGRDIEDTHARGSARSGGHVPERSSNRTASRGPQDSNETPSLARTPARDDSDIKSRTEHRQHRSDREQNYRLRDSEVESLTEIAKFRTVRTEDLIEFKYQGDRERAESDLRNLTAQGLVEKRTLHGREPGQLVTLSRNGKRFVENNGRKDVHKDQVFHQGFVKQREARHDAALYRLYQKAVEGIERDGGKNLRVILDYELKKDLYRDLAKLKALPANEQEEGRQQIAEAHGLKVVNGKIPLPDLRIEYENRDDEQARVDLELVTSDYRGHHLAEKAQAGFSIYAPADEATRVRAALQDPHLMTEILSL